jgi:hypothetical protein
MTSGKQQNEPKAKHSLVSYLRNLFFTCLPESLAQAIRLNLWIQAALLLVASMVLDTGHTQRIVMFAVCIWWVAILPIVFRRRDSPTKADLFVLRVGFLLALVLSSYSYPTWGWLRELLK